MTDPDALESPGLNVPTSTAPRLFIVLVLNVEDDDRSDEIEYRGRFSTTLPRNVGTAGRGRLALIVRRDGAKRTATHLGVARSTGVVSTFDHRVTVEPFVALADPIDLATLGRRMSPLHYGALKAAASNRGGELTANASSNLRTALGSYVSDDVWAKLVRLGGSLRRREIETLHGQYDALATGFALAGFSDLGDLQQRDYSASRSILETIRSSATEPDLMVQDLQHFAWTQSDSVTEHIHRFRQRDRILDVVNLNATPQEGATGVDLLYHNATFASFIGVQYKRVEPSGSRLARVDARFRSQIQRMLRVENLARGPAAPPEYRLGSSSMMFVKFARPAEVDAQVSGMSKGWYVPANYANALIRSGNAVGLNGGDAFTLENLNRWLNNDSFTALAREGWIGSVGIDHQALVAYIDRALADRRSVMLMEGSREE